MSYQTYLNEFNPSVCIQIQHHGIITLELFPSVAPNTVANFIDLIQKQYYDGLIFHRIIPNFMIQGGWGNESACAIKGEFKSNGVENPLKHTRGVISMARTNDPNSASSQFFIMHQDSPHLDGNYAAFGGVTLGFEVIDKIAHQPRNANDRPNQSIIIEKITVDLKGQDIQKPKCFSQNV